MHGIYVDELKGFSRLHMLNYW